MKEKNYPERHFRCIDNSGHSFKLNVTQHSTRTIDNYEILSKVGEGSYGIVYKAKEKKNQKVYAVKKLKILQGGFASHLREINALHRIKKHENIVNLEEVVVGNELNDVYLVMDYCLQDLGVILDNYSQKNPAFLMPHIKNLAYQLFSGLAFLHLHSIIHF